MEISKSGARMQTDEQGVKLYHVPAKYLGNVTDKRDMSALGRKQVLRRNFGFASILGFDCTLIATWEVMLTVLAVGLTNGGTAGLIWGFVIVCFGFLLVFASLAEMASMAPTSGGQYHWVSEFAPKSCQKFLSYVTGWLCTTGWQCALVSVAFLSGTIIQGLITLNYESYVFRRWHGTLLVIAITAFAIFFNTFLAKRLPMVEALNLILHIVGLFVIIIPLWVMAPRASTKSVFTQFNDNGGWDSLGISTLVGFSGIITSMTGYDCAVHMAEEIRNASVTLPKAMMSAIIINSVLGFVMLATICFTLGDIDSILASPTGYPFIQVFFNSTGSYAGTNAMTTVLILVLTSSTITGVATASRQLWSFARDNGIPFGEFFSYVSPRRKIPLNSVLVSLAVTALLSWINNFSTAALTAIVSLTITALMSSYIVSISCLVLKRIRGETLPERRWSLGKWGLAINIAALAYLCPVFVFAFFPLTSTVNKFNMNWSAVIYVGVISFATAYYWLGGRHKFVAPVALVKREQ